MAIDKSLDRMADIIANMHNDYVDHLAYGGKTDTEAEADIHAIDDVYKALVWYREQDLIRREDAIEILTQMQWHDENGYPVEDYEDKKQYAKDWIEQIPKAEPPSEPCVDCTKPYDCYDCEIGKATIKALEPVAKNATTEKENE